MKLYLIKDKISNTIISARTAENLDVFKRYLIANRIDLQKSGNHSSLRLLNDCEVYEAEILIDKNDASVNLCGVDIINSCGIGLSKVLCIKEFFDQFDNKSGSVEDKV